MDLGSRTCALNCKGKTPGVDVLLALDSLWTKITVSEVQEIRMLKLCRKVRGSQGQACVYPRLWDEEKSCGALG